MTNPLLGVVSLCVVLLASCGSGSAARTPSGALASCHVDADCVVTDFAGCCACCKSEPHALPRDEAARQQHGCDPASCPACDSGIQCPKLAARAGVLSARCQEGTCAVVAQ